ncbi:hypothetical protein BD311DRAFT_795303 [Dichomitus squalens]|uniref:Uncharacterized protein n=1 Tax=Dichomitus squalens TaxID=114155 RepID=A0A4V2K161_9APHY|nr:hypothetical protein BD311DRAFT_795303 [Dichomitus squalens]
MKDLKQTKLSFASVPRKSDATSRPLSGTTSASKDIPAKAQRRQGSLLTKARSHSGHAALECVEIPPPPKRSSRLKAASNASTPLKPSPSKKPISAQAREPSLKRKFSPPPDADTECSREVVHLPRIAVQPASSPATGQSSRQQRPLIPKDNNLVAGENDTTVPSRKKLRLSSPSSTLTPLPPSSLHDTESDDIEFVPTSQSDEQELTLPRIPVAKDPAAVQESVVKWRKETLAGPPSQADSVQSDPFYSPFSELSEVSIDVEFDPFPPSEDVLEMPAYQKRPRGHELQYPHTPCSSLATPASRPEPSALQRNSSSILDASPSEAFCSLTPPPSSVTDMPLEEVPQVEPMDTESKTRQLIADIKARAYAAAHSSPEQSAIEVGSLSDSESESSGEEDFATLIEKAKAKSRTQVTPAKAIAPTPTPEVTQRYYLRRNSPSSKPKARPTTPPPEGRKPSKNPIEVFLREKKREERNGTGMAAVRAAEKDLANSKSEAEQLSEMEDEEDGSSSGEDWERGLDLLRDHRKSKSKTSSPVTGPSGSHRSSRRSRAGTDDEDEETTAVGDILAKDMKENLAKALAKQNEQPVGVPLWSPVDAAEHDASMDMEFSLIIPSGDIDVSGNAMLQLLMRATRQNDIKQAFALLSSGLVGLLAMAQYSLIVPWLADVAFSDGDSSLRTLAYTQLMRLAPRADSRRSALDFSFVLRVLCRLGASPTVLEEHGWSIPSAPLLGVPLRIEERDEMCYRLASLVNSYAESFATEELSDVLLAMVLIGMDPTTPEGVRIDIRKACDSLEQAMDLAQQVELDACTKLVTFGKILSPPTQALLMSFIPGTSASTVRMARCVARSLLLDTTPSPEYQKNLPDLLPVVDLLVQEPGSCKSFDVVGNMGKEGYHDDLTCKLFILGRVLSDVDEYTLAEKQVVPKARKSELEEGADGERVQEKEPEQKLTLLQQVSRCLDLLHGKIVDTRAAHLDRSRAKAVIQRLSFRVHYQRAATLKAGTGDKSDLRRYFLKSS